MAFFLEADWKGIKMHPKDNPQSTNFFFLYSWRAH